MKKRLLVQRRLPAAGEILVQVGEQVGHDTVVGRLSYVPGPLVQCDIAKALGIAPSRLGEKLLKREEEFVEQGEALAANREFYSNRYYNSPVAGNLALWSRYLGYAYVRELLPTGAGEPQIINTERLGLSRAGFRNRLLVSEGQVVARGQKLFSGDIAVQAAATSKVERISFDEGHLVLAPLYQPREMRAYMDGVVAALPEPGVCTITNYGYYIVGAVGYGGESNGILQPLLGEERDLDAADIPDTAASRIVVARGGATLAGLRRLAECRVAGAILGSLHPDVLREFCGQEPLQQLGVMYDIPFVVVLLHGFQGAMREESYSELASLAGKRASICGKTQLRAGVVRPEILVPLPESIAEEDIPYVERFETIEPGDIVLLIGEPVFGARAMVLEVDLELRPTEAGTRASLAKVRLNDGAELWIPLCNCQRIPEESR